jgi:hypothetical protein
MTGHVPARAIALVWLAMLGCSSHVDVGFTNEAGASSINDGSAARGSEPAEAAVTMAAACVIVRVCDAGTCGFQPIFAPSCDDVCQRSIDICGNQCVDTSSDPNNCGRCRRACSPDETCVMGVCRP